MAKAESVDPPNNNDHERTLRSTEINALAALTPFVAPTAVRKAGFGSRQTAHFQPSTPSYPNPSAASNLPRMTGRTDARRGDVTFAITTTHPTRAAPSGANRP